MKLFAKKTHIRLRLNKFTAAILIIFFCRCLSTAAISSIDQSLSSIENKLFEHDYPKDDDKARLSRIENFVFGTTNAGSDQERLDSVLKVIPESTSTEKANQNTSENPTETKEPDHSSNSTKPNSKNISSESESQAPNSTFQFSHYPRVTTLEQQLLGHSYEDQGLAERLSRLEDKCFKKTSTNPDLNERVESLELYAQRHDLYGDHNRTASAFNNNSAPLPPPQPSQQNIENMVIIMENKEFGHPFPKRSLQKRISKLEGKVYHHDNEKSNLTIVARTNNLWSTLMLNSTTSNSTENYQKQSGANYSSQPIGNNMSDQYGTSTASSNSVGYDYSNNNSNSSSLSKPHHSLLHKVAQVGGTVAGATVKALSASSGMGGYGMGGYPMGGYGMGGYPMGGYGMGGYPMGGYGMSGYPMGYGMNSYRYPSW